MEEDDKRKNLDFVPSSYEEVEEVEEDFVDETRLDICHLEICFLCYSSPIVDHIPRSRSSYRRLRSSNRCVRSF